MPKWIIARLKLNDKNADCVMYAVIPPDDETGYVVGELDEVLELSATLKSFIDAGGHTATEIDELDARLGGHWLSTSQVVRQYSVPLSTVRSWMAASPHAKKPGREWCAPEIVVRGWVARWTPHAPAKK